MGVGEREGGGFAWFLSGVEKVGFVWVSVWFGFEHGGFVLIDSKRGETESYLFCVKSSFFFQSRHVWIWRILIFPVFERERERGGTVGLCFFFSNTIIASHVEIRLVSSRLVYKHRISRIIQPVEIGEEKQCTRKSSAFKSHLYVCNEWITHSLRAWRELHTAL